METNRALHQRQAELGVELAVNTERKLRQRIEQAQALRTGYERGTRFERVRDASGDVIRVEKPLTEEELLVRAREYANMTIPDRPSLSPIEDVLKRIQERFPTE